MTFDTLDFHLHDKKKITPIIMAKKRLISGYFKRENTISSGVKVLGPLVA